MPVRGVRRHAFCLVDVVLAVALAAGPMLLAANLVLSNVRAARFNRERAVARMVLLDLSTLLQGESLSELDAGLANDRLTAVLRERIGLMPEAGREAYLAQAGALLENLQGQLEKEIDATRPGLARLSLSARLPDRTVAQVSALFRPRARERMRQDETGDCALEEKSDSGR